MPLTANFKTTVRYMQRTHDADGVYFERLPPTGEGKLKMVKAIRPGGPKGGVVKIDWPTVRAAYDPQAATEDRFRARERILRICRGEDPATV